MQVSILSGPAGIGKSTWVNIIAKETGALVIGGMTPSGLSILPNVTSTKFIILDDATQEHVEALKELESDIRVIVVLRS